MSKFTFVTETQRGFPKRVTVVIADSLDSAIKKLGEKYPKLKGKIGSVDLDEIVVEELK